MKQYLKSKLVNRMMVTVLMVALLFNGVFALSFPDIKNDYWAKPFIERMSTLGIVTGYNDGTFKPDGNLTKYQMMVVLYRTLESQKLVNATEATTLKTKYADVLAKNSVPKWPGLHEAISIFLERGVIKAAELSTFIVEGKEAPIDRETVAIYVGKALNFYLKEDLSQLISLNLKDMNKISFEGLKYINILNKHGIVGGDSQNLYNPDAILTRAQLTKILATSIDTLTKLNTPKEKLVEASVVAKLDDSKRVIFFEKGSTTASYTEVIDANVSVTINDKPATYAELVVNLPVTLTYLGGKLTKVSGKATVIAPKTYTGLVSSVVVFQGKSFLYYIDDEAKKTISYELVANAPITSKGQPKAFTDMLKDDKVTITVIGDKISAIDYQVRIGQVTGLVKAVVVKDTPQLVVTVNGKDVTLPITAAAKVVRNGQEKTLSAMLAGDQVVVDTIFDVVTQVTATGLAVKEFGVIQEVKLGTIVELIIKGTDGKVATYTVAGNAKVTIDGAVKTVFDLRPNYTVEVKAESAVASEITATSKVAKDYLVGVVQTVYRDLRVIVISANNQSYNVTLNADAKLLMTNGLPFDLVGIKMGHTIFVYGLKTDKGLTGELVLLLE